MPVKTSRRWTTALLLAAGLWGAFAAEAALAGVQAPDGTAREASSPAGPTAFVCPMHPDYTLETPGSCPRCGMALVKATPFDVRNYRVDLTTTPAVIRAGQPARWSFRVFRPDSDELVTRFERVHERQYPPVRRQPGHGRLPAHSSGDAARRLMDARRHVAEGEVPQGAVGLHAVWRRGAAHRSSVVTAGFAGDLPSSRARLAGYEPHQDGGEISRPRSRSIRSRSSPASTAISSSCWPIAALAGRSPTCKRISGPSGTR